MGFGNMNKMMKQVQKLQANMAKLQAELAERVVEASAGGGAVTVKARGDNELVEIKIDTEVVDPEDMEMLEDMVLAAANEALRKARDMVAEEMGKLTGGLNLPPGLF
ncbi:MAG: YbaB/EbfC family nucleoid-associated protein [bacterium]|jgi:DNA-binding YbaB/EbfC family protein